jgi:hypothetical protein
MADIALAADSTALEAFKAAATYLSESTVSERSSVLFPFASLPR